MTINCPANDAVGALHDHLQGAIAVELSTIPPYLYALYSIADPASEAAKILRSVVVEEMLHATLMANVLVAVGGRPRFYHRSTIPAYPGPWPHRVPELTIRLRRCTQDHVRSTFLEVERPIDAPATDPTIRRGDAFDSQGHFYAALERMLVNLDETSSLFTDPQVERQLTDPDGYHTVKFDSPASGGLVAVTSLDSALAAIEIPIHQGEGSGAHDFADSDRHERTHYAKFRRLADGSTPIGAIRPAIDDPHRDAMPDDVRPLAVYADALYCFTMVLLDRLYATTDSARRRSTLGTLYGVMSGMLAPACRFLMTLPAGENAVWGPAFEFFQFSDASEPEADLRALATELASDHPGLRASLRHIDRL
ncbi:MAG: ferritin-like protein [Actinomycetota bacterium]